MPVPGAPHSHSRARLSARSSLLLSLPSCPVHQVTINTPAQRNYHDRVKHREVVEPAPQSRVHITVHATCEVTVIKGPSGAPIYLSRGDLPAHVSQLQGGSGGPDILHLPCSTELSCLITSQQPPSFVTHRLDLQAIAHGGRTQGSAAGSAPAPGSASGPPGARRATHRRGIGIKGGSPGTRTGCHTRPSSSLPLSSSRSCRNGAPASRCDRLRDQ
jgi:hypothetical protein